MLRRLHQEAGKISQIVGIYRNFDVIYTNGGKGDNGVNIRRLKTYRKRAKDPTFDELTHLPHLQFLNMGRKKLNKVHRHTVRFTQKAEDCLIERAARKNMSANQYIENLVLEDCKRNG